MLVTPPPAKLFLAVRFDQHAITMSTNAPYDTVRLAAVAYDGTFTPMAAQPTITIAGGDSSVRVTQRANGDVLLTGRAAIQRMVLVASATVGNTRQVDTAYVTVTNVVTPPVISVFSVHPPAGDSAKFAGSLVNYARQLPMTILDNIGNPVDSLDVYYTSSDSLTGIIDRFSGYLSPRVPGIVTYGASATLYGVRYADSVAFTISPPLYAFVSVATRSLINSPTLIRSFSPSTVTISVGGTVGWDPGRWGDSLDVTFSDTTGIVADPDYPAGSGNIPKFANRDSTIGFFEAKRFRVFTRAGTYTYHSTVFPDSGTVIVR